MGNCLWARGQFPPGHTRMSVFPLRTSELLVQEASVDYSSYWDVSIWRHVGDTMWPSNPTNSLEGMKKRV